MRVIRSINEFKKYRKSIENLDIGFVKTMGAISFAHKELIKACVEQNDISIVSIMINPTKFTSKEELEKHPKAEILDIDICKNLKVDVVFIPKLEDLTQNQITLLAPKQISQSLEGILRPNHFDRLLVILNRLFNLIKPTRAYFGKKDAQQLALVYMMMKDFFMDIEIKAHEIIRQKDGLAISSSNQLLNDMQKLYALRIFRSLLKAKTIIEEESILDVKIIKEKMLEILEPLELEYLAFVTRDFEELTKIEKNNTIILVAVHIGKIRLSDNLWI